MPKQFKQKLNESLDRVISEVQSDFHEPVRRQAFQASNTVPPEVDQAIGRVLVQLNREHHAETRGYYQHDWYGEEFADRLREEWIEDSGGIVDSNIEQELYDLAQELIVSDSEDQHERNMSDPSLSADQQYRTAGREKYGPGHGW